MMRALTSPWRWFLRLLGDRAAMPLRRLSWRFVRRMGKVGAAVLPRRRRASRLELILFVWGADQAELETAAADSGVEPGRLLIVTDRPRFSRLHRAGVAVEYIPPAGEASGRLPDFDAGELLMRRVALLLASYPHEAVAVAGAAPVELTKALTTLAGDGRELDGT